MSPGPIERLDFVGAAGARLSGALHLPDGPPAGSVLLAHCFTCSKDLHTSTRLARALREGGYAVLRFDFTGLGESGGEFEHTNVSTNIGDLSRAAVALLELGYGPCVLIGHSLGGAAAILAAHRLKTVSAVVVIGAPADVAHVTHLFGEGIERIEREGRARVDIGGRPFDVSSDFLADLQHHSVLEAVAELARPFLVIVGSADEIVDPGHGERLFEAAAQPKRLVVLDGADHLLTNRSHAAAAAREILDWLGATRSASPPS